METKTFFRDNSARQVNGSASQHGRSVLRLFRGQRTDLSETKWKRLTRMLFLGVLARGRGVDPLNQVFGNLGQGLRSQFRTYTIDFSDMRLSVGENVR